jgi:hypothetical protein
VNRWVSDDGRSLFAALDVTADNTLDAGKDYGQLFVKSPAGVREFKVTTLQERWGRAGFEYTDLVGWEHKVYEMAIPLAELGANSGAELELAFAAYGTMAPPPALEYGADPNGVDPDRGASGTSFTFTVEYWDIGGNAAPSRRDVWIDLDRDGQEDAASIAAPFGSGPLG